MRNIKLMTGLNRRETNWKWSTWSLDMAQKWKRDRQKQRIGVCFAITTYAQCDRVRNRHWHVCTLRQHRYSWHTVDSCGFLMMRIHISKQKFITHLFRTVNESNDEQPSSKNFWKRNENYSDNEVLGEQWKMCVRRTAARKERGDSSSLANKNSDFINVLGQMLRKRREAEEKQKRAVVATNSGTNILRTYLKHCSYYFPSSPFVFAFASTQ